MELKRRDLMLAASALVLAGCGDNECETMAKTFKNRRIAATAPALTVQQEAYVYAIVLACLEYEPPAGSTTGKGGIVANLASLANNDYSKHDPIFDFLPAGDATTFKATYEAVRTALSHQTTKLAVQTGLNLFSQGFRTLMTDMFNGDPYDENPDGCMTPGTLGLLKKSGLLTA